MQENRFVIITGLSGAGKSQAMRAFEDLGFFCVDNLPPVLIPKFAELCAQTTGRVDRVAVVVDIRGGDFFDDIMGALDNLDEMGLKYDILFLDAEDDVLIRRYKETRRRHPVSPYGSLLEGIQGERRRLEKLKLRAHHLIDTTEMDSRELKERIFATFSNIRSQERIHVSVVTFGFKFGLPMDADLVFDVRFLPNPHYVDELRPMTGNDQGVRDYVFRNPVTGRFVNKTSELLLFLLPYYITEGKSTLIVAVGCTGGRHRSVAIGNKLAEVLRSKGYSVSVEHRDVQQI